MESLHSDFGKALYQAQGIAWGPPTQLWQASVNWLLESGKHGFKSPIVAL